MAAVGRQQQQAAEATGKRGVGSDKLGGQNGKVNKRQQEKKTKSDDDETQSSSWLQQIVLQVPGASSALIASCFYKLASLFAGLVRSLFHLAPSKSAAAVRSSSGSGSGSDQSQQNSPADR